MVQPLAHLGRSLDREMYACYLAIGDARTPWYAKVFAFGLVAYAVSPIDLIPDPVPLLGYLDDLLILPLGIIFLRRHDSRSRVGRVSRVLAARLDGESGGSSGSRWCGDPDLGNAPGVAHLLCHTMDEIETLNA